MMPNENRRSPRRRVPLRMIYDDGESWVAALAVDASELGLNLETPSPLEIGRRVRLEPVDPVEDPLFEMNALVVRCRELDPDVAIDRFGAPLYELGVVLLDNTAEKRRAIAKMIENAVVRELARPSSNDPYLGRTRKNV